MPHSIPSMNAHMCLVSDQPTPNLTPTLDDRVRPKKVVLIRSKDMMQRTKWVGDVLSNHGMEVHAYNLQSDPWDLENLKKELSSLVSQMKNEGLALNVTGGTKPMALAAHEVFRTFALPVFYVHPEKDRLIWLYPEAPAIDLANRVRINNFFAAHGFRLVSSPNRASIPESWKKLTKQLIDSIDRFGKPLGTVNYLASSAEKRLTSDEIPTEKRKWKELLDLLALFERGGFLRRTGERLVFLNEESRFFVNGGWLEYHVKDVLDQIRSELLIQDIAQGVEVCSAESCQVKNEIDVAFLAENRLYIIECKTKKFDRPDATEGSETLYKLDTLTEFGGNMAQGMLVSFRELPPPDRKRAETMKIKTVVGRSIQQIEKEIREWVRPQS